MNEKIFCVGLPRTGTNSFIAAMKELGIPALHGNNITKSDMSRFYTGDFTLSTESLSKYQAFADIPFPTYFRELYAHHPGAKFVLLTRSRESWLRSVEQHFARVPGAYNTVLINKKDGRKEAFAAYCTEDSWLLRRLAMFGLCTFYRPRYERIFEQHKDAVRHFIPHERLLEIDLSDGSAWQSICNFLEIESVPSSPFPHLNKGQR